MSNLYKKTTKADIKNKAGGYKPHLFFAPIASFATVAMPVVDENNRILADDVKITTSHTFNSPDGFIDFLGKINSATSTFTTVGDPGSGIYEHTFKIVFEGDSPEMFAQLRDLRDDECIFLLKDSNCIAADSYHQFGDDCLTAAIKIDFDGKTSAEGNKEFTLTGTIREHKYWYYGDLTEKIDENALTCPVVSLVATNNKITANLVSLNGANHAIFKLFTVASGGSATQTHTGAATATTDEFTGLTAATTYYVQVIPVSTAGTQLTTCARVGIATTA